MNPDLLTACQLLEEGQYTCVLVSYGQVYTSCARGVAPLLSWLESGNVQPGFSAADKVVGKATAYLYCLLGAKSVYADVMSEAAKAVFSAAGIHASWGKEVPHIRNRQNTGMCPMEEATLNCTTPEEALFAIRETLQKLRS